MELKEDSCDNCQGRFRVSSVGHDNLGFDGTEKDSGARTPRRLSVPDFINNLIPGRKLSAVIDCDGGISRKNSRSNSIFKDFFKDSDPKVMDYNQEAAPRLENYRNSLTVGQYAIRPSLDELHEAYQGNHHSLSPGKCENKSGTKFGWIKGVYIRCLLNIWGVMLFLRMGWMTGQCGMILAIVIILLSTVVTVITTLSMSAICTNGYVRGGGPYYMISRSLGPEFGGVVGILLFLANAVSGALYILGAGEAIGYILTDYDIGIVEYPTGTNDIRLTSVLCLILMMSITGIGMAFENKTQMILLVLLLSAMMNYFVGACLPPNDSQIAEGFVGWNAATALTNALPDFRGETFFSVFAVFFPSVTGILAGASISGDLKDPCSAIPKGTLLSILTTSTSYVLIVIWLGCTTLRDASGNIEEFVNGTFGNCTLIHCKFGLENNYQLMTMVAAFGPLIYAGIFAATLSSALVSIVSAPRILQALCVDKIFPWLNWFGKGYGNNNDPRRALGLTFIIAVVFTCIGDLNAVAPIISNFFMAANGLINFACFHASYIKSPGFRPGFRYYNKWLSLLGALLCVVIMFVMNWITALVTDVVVVALYVYIGKTCPDINWGSSFQGFVYRNALYYLNKLSRVEDHVKNFRPGILVLSGNTCSRPQLVDLAGHLTKDHGLLICAHILRGVNSWKTRRLLNDLNNKWLHTRKLKGFYTSIEAETLVNGVSSLIQAVGVGKMKPNILLVGFKENWKTCDPKEMLDYFNIIHEVLDGHLSFCILRMPGGTDYSKYFEGEDGLPLLDREDKNKNIKSKKTRDIKIFLETVHEEPSHLEGSTSPPSYISVDLESTTKNTEQSYQDKCFESAIQDLTDYKWQERKDCETLPPYIERMTNLFHVKQEKGSIDVWWLYDDGGLTILLPHILTARSRFKDCKLRVFSLAQDDTVIDDEQLNLAVLLQKFRIPFSDLSVLSSAGEPLHEQSAQTFERLISKWIARDDLKKDPMAINRNTLNQHKRKTNQFLRLRELLEKHSKSSNMIVMTLPLPRKEECPAPLYMAWLDILTNDMPPFLLIRGNQDSVLTFYS